MSEEGEELGLGSALVYAVGRLQTVLENLGPVVGVALGVCLKQSVVVEDALLSEKH